MLEVLPTLSPLRSIQMEMARASIKMPKGRNNAAESLGANVN
jgi:hypothetical protein